MNSQERAELKSIGAALRSRKFAVAAVYINALPEGPRKTAFKEQLRSLRGDGLYTKELSHRHSEDGKHFNSGGNEAYPASV